MLRHRRFLYLSFSKAKMLSFSDSKKDFPHVKGSQSLWNYNCLLKFFTYCKIRSTYLLEKVKTSFQNTSPVWSLFKKFTWYEISGLTSSFPERDLNPYIPWHCPKWQPGLRLYFHIVLLIILHKNFFLLGKVGAYLFVDIWLYNMSVQAIYMMDFGFIIYATLRTFINTQCTI